MLLSILSELMRPHDAIVESAYKLAHCCLGLCIGSFHDGGDVLIGLDSVSD